MMYMIKIKPKKLNLISCPVAFFIDSLYFLLIIIQIKSTINIKIIGLKILKSNLSIAISLGSIFIFIYIYIDKLIYIN